MIEMPLFSVSPLPSVNWEQEDLQKLGGKYLFRNNNATLEIVDINERIAGRYRCRGEAAVDFPPTEWETIEVTVQRVPTAKMPPFVAKMVGESLELVCAAEGIPTPEVQFLVKGERFDGIFFRFLPCLVFFGPG